MLNNSVCLLLNYYYYIVINFKNRKLQKMMGIYYNMILLVLKKNHPLQVPCHI